MKVQIQNSLFMISEIKVSYHPKFKAYERPKINDSKDAYNILFNNWDQGRIEMTEQFVILLLRIEDLIRKLNMGQTVNVKYNKVEYV